MIVQQAIEHARKVARDKRADADWKWRHGRLNADDCISCAEEHEQLAEWLEELEQYRALGTVEDIIKHRDNLEQENHEYSCLGTLEELKEAMEFKKYFDELYGEGLEIANWHKNGDLEPFDSFYESALKWGEEDD